MISLKRRWAEVIENSPLLTASSLRSFTSLVAKHLLDHFLSLLTAHLLLALILHYYSSLTLYLTLFLSCATHTLPWVFSNSLQTTFRFFFLTVYLPLVAWACQHLGTRDCCTPQPNSALFKLPFFFGLFPFAPFPVTSLLLNYLQTLIRFYTSRRNDGIRGGCLLPGCDSAESREGLKRPQGGTCRSYGKS